MLSLVRDEAGLVSLGKAVVVLEAAEEVGGLDFEVVGSLLLLLLELLFEASFDWATC